MNSKMPLTVLVAIFAATTGLQASQTQIDISGQVNADIQTYTGGANYQFGGTQLNVNGVGFGLAELGNSPTTTGVVQTPSDGQLHPYTFAVPANTYATTLYTLINTAWGGPGVNEGSIVVTGTGGETATLNLIEGFNIRDHFNDGYVDSLTDPTVVSTYFVGGVPNSTGGSDRLDMQELNLPTTFNGDTIASIIFNGIGNGEPNGSPFLAGATLVNAVPESSTVAIFMFGIVTMFGIRRIPRQT
jgi:hypothetical protein